MQTVPHMNSQWQQEHVKKLWKPNQIKPQHGGRSWAHHPTPSCDQLAIITARGWKDKLSNSVALIS